MTHNAEKVARGQRFYAWLPPILNRAAKHGCLDEDVETGDPIVCADCYVFPPGKDQP